MRRRRPRLRPDWRSRATRRLAFWSALWAAEAALAGLWPNLADQVPLPVFLALGVLLPAAHAVAGVFHLPGADQ